MKVSWGGMTLVQMVRCDHFGGSGVDSWVGVTSRSESERVLEGDERPRSQVNESARDRSNGRGEDGGVRVRMLANKLAAAARRGRSVLARRTSVGAGEVRAVGRGERERRARHKSENQKDERRHGRLARSSDGRAKTHKDKNGTAVA